MLKNVSEDITEDITEELTAALAHEVKNPVSLIIANLELLESEGIFISNEKNIRLIKKELHKISTILTDFSLLCKPKNKDNFYKFNLFELVEDVEEEYRITNYSADINFYLNCFCELNNGIILGNEFKIEMLLSNIYKNAVESLKDNKGQIITKIYQEKIDNNNKIIVEVIDSGHGIKKEIEDKIFKPFNTTKENGNGLGLAICQGIISEIGGNLTIRNNELENGCTVRMEFNA